MLSLFTTLNNKFINKSNVVGVNVFVLCILFCFFWSIMYLQRVKAAFIRTLFLFNGFQTKNYKYVNMVLDSMCCGFSCLKLDHKKSSKQQRSIILENYVYYLMLPNSISFSLLNEFVINQTTWIDKPFIFADIIFSLSFYFNYCKLALSNISKGTCVFF